MGVEGKIFAGYGYGSIGYGILEVKREENWLG